MTNATEKQIRYLEVLRYEGDLRKLTIQSASEAIEKLKTQQIRGDLSTLDLVGVFEALGYSTSEVEAGKYWVKCPWAHEHSWTHPKDTVIWQDNNSWPEFHCSHNHCEGRKLEIVIEWAESKSPGIINRYCSHQLVGGESKPKSEHRQERKKATKLECEKLTPEQEKHHTLAFLGCFRVTEADLWHDSAIYPGANWRTDSVLVLRHLYLPEEFVCICTDYEIITKSYGSSKAVPKGCGQTRRAADWIKQIKGQGTPESAAGAWIRLNPVTERGTGVGGAHTDDDVSAWRYLLVESDALSVEVQLSLYTKLAMPIAMLCTSGGKSVHAWVRLNSLSKQDFRADADFILSRLSRFGVDRANRNPSRYGRLPGALRQIGAEPALCAEHCGQQRILLLNPNPSGGPIFP